MPKIICLCGKICSGKSTYADILRKEEKAIVLSVDEIALSLFPMQMGEQHDEMTGRIKEYLLEKTYECIESGINVILDWGFWTRQEREKIRSLCKEKKIVMEWHHLDIDENELRRRIQKRNKDIEEGRTKAYYVDDRLADKMNLLFEIPEKEEMDVWIKEEE